MTPWLATFLSLELLTPAGQTKYYLHCHQCLPGNLVFEHLSHNFLALGESTAFEVAVPTRTDLNSSWLTLVLSTQRHQGSPGNHQQEKIVETVEKSYLCLETAIVGHLLDSQQHQQYLCLETAIVRHVLNFQHRQQHLCLETPTVRHLPNFQHHQLCLYLEIAIVGHLLRLQQHQQNLLAPRAC